MFRPQIQKTHILLIIALFNLFLVYISATSKEYIKKDGLEEKLKATKIMSDCSKSLFEVAEENNNDLYKTGLVGKATSSITTIFDADNQSMKKSKIACTHPNFSALVVEKFQELDLKVGDYVAISMTGSLPGANLAVIAACEAMGIRPVIISSVGSSAWGANNIEFSWLDMELYLYEKNFINYKSIASSIGGKDDLGGQISEEGIEDIEKIIGSKNIELVNKENLQANVSKKISIFDSKNTISNYKAFINIGGGAASIGSGYGKNSLKAGIISPLEKNKIDYEGFSTSIAKYFLDKGVPFINIKNINLLAKPVGLYPPDKSIEINQGPLFYLEKDYNLIIIIISILLSVLSIGGVGFYSHYEIKKRMKEYDPDSIV
mgnify:FL=1